MGFFLDKTRKDLMDQEDNILDELLHDIAGLLHEYPKALERQAAALHAMGRDPELVEKLVKAADTMRDSGNLYLTWARHFAALAEGNTDASSDEDDTEDFGV